MKKLSIIIVNYNTRDILEKCLENLRILRANNSTQAKEVIVVDNGSKDGSTEMVRTKFPEVTLIESENIGLAAGSNLGLRKSTGDYILYLGSDAFPEVGVLEGMMEYMEKDNSLGIATCKLLTRDSKYDMDAHRGFPTLWVSFTYFFKLYRIFPKSCLFGGYFMEYENLDIPHEIDLCISHFMLVKREVFEKIGEWDERFFVFGEDVDLCYRVKKAGFKIMYLPQWTCIHFKGSSVGLRKESKDVSKASSETKKRMKVVRAQARFLFFEKYYSTKYPKVFLYLLKLIFEIEKLFILL